MPASMEDLLSVARELVDEYLTAEAEGADEADVECNVYVSNFDDDVAHMTIIDHVGDLAAVAFTGMRVVEVDTTDAVCIVARLVPHLLDALEDDQRAGVDA